MEDGHQSRDLENLFWGWQCRGLACCKTVWKARGRVNGYGRAQALSREINTSGRVFGRRSIMSEGRICTTNSWHRLDTGQRAFGQSLLPMRIIAIPLSFRCCTDVSCNCSSSFFSPSFFDSRKNCPVLTAQNDL